MEQPQDMRMMQGDENTFDSSHKKAKLVKVFAFLTLIISVAAMAMTLVGISNSVGELDNEIAKNSVDAILAKAEINNSTAIRVPVVYYDQEADKCVDLYNISLQDKLNARQFEWKECGYYNYGLETGIVESELNDKFLPVANGGRLLTNRGVKGDNFERWFGDVDGLSKGYNGFLNLSYDAGSASFKYKNEEFYPLDNDSNKHNKLFTMNLAVPFQVLANNEEEFNIVADDDTWVFVGKDLVIDMGGVHDAVLGSLKIDEDGEIYTSINGQDFAYSGVNLEKGGSGIIRVYHADRNSMDSVFEIEFKNMVLNITNSKIADGDGVEIAYDPSNPSYIAPLGESLVVGPDKSRAIIASMTIQVSAAAIFGVVMIAAISLAWRYLRRDRNPVK